MTIKEAMIWVDILRNRIEELTEREIIFDQFEYGKQMADLESLLAQLNMDVTSAMLSIAVKTDVTEEKIKMTIGACNVIPTTSSNSSCQTIKHISASSNDGIVTM